MKLKSSDKVKLIQKGNEFFNKKDYINAEKLFLISNYQDGLIRLGNYYLELKNYIKAIFFYNKAKFLKGEYEVYKKLGLCNDKFDFHDKKQKSLMDEQINRTLANIITKFLKLQ